MITASNYFNQVSKIGIQNLPETLKKSHDFVNRVTANGQNWRGYDASATIKNTIDLYFSKLDEFEKTSVPAKKAVQKKEAKPAAPKKKPARSKVKSATRKPSIKKDKARAVESVKDEIKFILRFVNMHGKDKTWNQIRLFINAMQRTILEKKIRKTSPYAKHIRLMQDSLISMFNGMGVDDTIKVDIQSKTLSVLLKIAGKEKQMASIRFIKSYVGLQGRIITKEKAKNLYNRIANAINKNKLLKSDHYYGKVQAILKSLKLFAERTKSVNTLQIHSAELNGLMGILNGCGECLDGLDDTSQSVLRNTIMNSEDVVNLKFDKLGFQGKWLDFIGDPGKGFTAMVYGRPKMGKSYLSVEFAGYLARSHGTVLYVAREEGIDDTMQQKLKDKDVAHPDLFVSDFLPDDLSRYDFIFIDSVTKQGLTPSQLEALQRSNPGKSFIYVFQVTKDGTFRGRNEFAHDVDVLIEVPEKGIAVQNGRFNQGGQMEIFDSGTLRH